MKQIKKCWALLMLMAGLASMQANAVDCSAIPQYIDGNSYNAGDEVQAQSQAYRCDVAGWCSLGGPYAPGSGWAWAEAWTALGSCGSTSTVEFSLTHPASAEQGQAVQVTATVTAASAVDQSALLVSVDGQSLTHTGAGFTGGSGGGAPVVSSHFYSWQAAGVGLHSVEGVLTLGAATPVTRTGTIDVSNTSGQGPVITGLNIPATATVGTPILISATLSDPDGFVQSVSVDVDNVNSFQQDSPTGLTALNHTWVAEYGTHEIKVTATDNTGISTSSSAFITVTGGVQLELTMDMPGLFLVGETAQLRALVSGFNVSIASWELTVQDFGAVNPVPIVVASGGPATSPLTLTGNVYAGTIGPGHYVAIATVVDNSGAVFKQHKQFGIEDPANPITFVLDAPPQVIVDGSYRSVSVTANNVPNFADVSVRMDTSEMVNFIDTFYGGSSSSGGNGSYSFSKFYTWFPSSSTVRTVEATLNGKVVRRAFIAEIFGGSGGGSSSGGSSSSGSSGGSSSSGASSNGASAMQSVASNIASGVQFDLNHDASVAHGRVTELSAVATSVDNVQGLGFTLDVTNTPAAYSHTYTTGGSGAGQYKTSAFYLWQPNFMGSHTVSATLSGAGGTPVTKTGIIDVERGTGNARMSIDVRALEVVQTNDTVQVTATARDPDSTIAAWELGLRQRDPGGSTWTNLEVLASGSKSGGATGETHQIFSGNWTVNHPEGVYDLYATVTSADGEVRTVSNFYGFINVFNDASIIANVDHPLSVQDGSGPVRITLTADRFAHYQHNAFVTVSAGQLTHAASQLPSSISFLEGFDWVPPGPGTYNVTATIPANPDHAWSQRMVAEGFPKDLVFNSTIQVSSAGGGGGGGGVCSGLSAWDSSIAYVGGSEVQHLGRKYKARWWTQGQDPATNNNSWQVWEDLGACT